jgi:hypothetical protein
MPIEAAAAGGTTAARTLREIEPVRQDASCGLRRWFQDDYFDLFLWQDHAGAPLGFQLCYDRSRAEGAISWSTEAGFTHARVDGGDRLSGRHPMSPLLRAAGHPPYFRIYNCFLEASTALEPRLRAFVIERLRDYRTALFGVPRKPPRRFLRSHIRRLRSAAGQVDSADGGEYLALPQQYGADLNLSLRAPYKTG